MDTPDPPVANQPSWTPQCPAQPHVTALTAVRGGDGCQTTKQKKKKKNTTDQLGLFLSLLCSFLRFLLLFLQAFLWRTLLPLLRRPETGRGTQHKHLSPLPPSISPSSREEVVDRLGKLILSHRHLQLFKSSLHLIHIVISDKTAAVCLNGEMGVWRAEMSESKIGLINTMALKKEDSSLSSVS